MSNAASYQGFQPGLTVNDVAKSVEFYTKALGFEVVDKHEAEGQLRFAMLKAGDAQIGVGQDDFAKGRDRVKGAGVRFWLQTSQDLNALAEQVKAAGGTLDSEVMDLPWGQKAFALKDPDGYAITIAAAR